MKKLAIGFLGLVGVLATSVGTAMAIQYGQADGNDHPHVGILAVYAANNQALWRCSGTMISEDIFLTAGHCVQAPAVKGHIWFHSEPADLFANDYPWPGATAGVPNDGSAGLPTKSDASGTPIPHPSFAGLTVPQTSDVGIVKLDTPYPMSRYGVVADVGELDALATKRGKQDTTFTVVGYGLQSVKPTLQQVTQRRQGTVSLVNLTSQLTDGWNLHYTNNPGKGNGEGGTSFGDSGGPVFLGDTDVIVAVNSFVLNANSKGAGFGYRVDTTYAQDFLDDND